MKALRLTFTLPSDWPLRVCSQGPDKVWSILYIHSTNIAYGDSSVGISCVVPIGKAYDKRERCSSCCACHHSVVVICGHQTCTRWVRLCTREWRQLINHLSSKSRVRVKPQVLWGQVSSQVSSFWSCDLRVTQVQVVNSSPHLCCSINMGWFISRSRQYTNTIKLTSSTLVSRAKHEFNGK